MRRLLALAAIAVLALSATAASAQQYSFVVTGDDRSDDPPRPGMDADGINTTVMTELVAQILKIKPRFVLFNGDLVHGQTTEPGFRTQIGAWIALMKPVYEAGVHVYPIRGNHDVSSVNADRVWNEAFSGPYALPGNGPEGEKNVTFAAAEENALIIGLDEYGRHKHMVNLAWLRRQLERNTLPLVFVMGHEMAFRAGHHRDNLDNHEPLRDEFLDVLGKARARVYFAGHDHFYDHQQITDPKRHPDVKIDQFVVGTAGAPFYQGRDYDGSNGSWTITHVKHIEMTYGYVLAKVDGPRVSLFFMGRVAPGVYEALDTFAYQAAAAAAPAPAAGR